MSQDPLDQEIAVDPEMLGKVFENLLDKKERGSKKGFFILPGNCSIYVSRI